MDNQSQEQILVLPNVDDLLKRTFSIYKARLGTFLGIMAFPSIVSVFLSLILFAVLNAFPILGIFLSVIGFLVVIIIGFWSRVSLIFAVKEREEKIGIVESFKNGWQKIISFAWISILEGFITLGGFLLFVIPGIIFSIWFAFAQYVLVSENLRGMNALFRSKQLVTGYWWKVLWRFLVMGIIIILFLGLAFGILFGIGFLLPFLKPFIKSIIHIISILFITPFSVTFGLLLYEELKKTKAQIVFEPPSGGTKIKFILIGIIGLLLIPAILISIVWVSLGGAREKTKDVKIMVDMSQIRTIAKIVYMNEGNYGNLSCDRPELISLCNDIKDLTGKKPTFYSSSDAYCIYTKLLSGKYYCLDSTSKAEEISTFPGNPGYCDGRNFVCS